MFDAGGGDKIDVAFDRRRVRDNQLLFLAGFEAHEAVLDALWAELLHLDVRLDREVLVENGLVAVSLGVDIQDQRRRRRDFVFEAAGDFEAHEIPQGFGSES